MTLASFSDSSNTPGPKQARFVSRIALVMGFTVGFVNMFGVTLGRNYIGRIFTSEPEVLAYVKKVVSPSLSV